ncbi:cation:proton antiporter [Caulobacter sp. DWR2-3-1b2]|uniref:cation:proton antiporter n=1 Tax=unclassified Caulobacter TaxID=2648921 RepID=UPI003CF3ADEC
MFDPYLLFLLGLGVVVLLVAWLPMALSRLPLSLAILCVLIGVAVFHGGVVPFRSDPLRFSTLTERMTEIVVIVSLMGAGLKIDRRIGLKRWASAWRLIAITMPLSILGVTLMGMHGLGLGLASALLLGAALAPTDPVLASDVQVGPPMAGDRGEARFSLTAEAGLNDGFAFPFVHLAVAIALAGGAASQGLLTHWLTIDVLWRVAAGVSVGWGVGKLLGWATFKAPHARMSGTGDGLVALGATLVAYGVTEAAHGYGFLAVFVAGLALRETERDHVFHEAMHDFAEQVERLLMMLVLVLLGGAVAGGLLDSLTWKEIAFGLALVFVIRPLAGWIGLIGSPHSLRERALVAFFGIRGIGSLYYLAYGLNHGHFQRWDRLWAITGFVVLCSILVHGVTATPLMARIDAWRAANKPR